MSAALMYRQRVASSDVKGLDQWRLSIPTVDTKPNGTSFYNLMVRNEFMSWVVPYRYSVIHEFKQKMERRFPHLQLPSFPPKHFSLFGEPGPEFLEERRCGLESFLQTLLQDPRFHCRELKQFLDPMKQAEKGEQARRVFVNENQSRSLVSASPSPTLESYDDLAEDSFLLPNFPPGTNVPSVVVLENGEECFIAPLIEEMKTNIEYLFKLQRKMKGKDIDIQLHLLEDERGKINTACMTLEGERRLLEGQLLKDKNVKNLAVLHTWLEFSHDKVAMALNWANSVEENLLLALSPQVSKTSAPSTPASTSHSSGAQSDGVKEDLLIDLSGPVPPPSVIPIALLQPQFAGHPYPAPPAYYYPPPYSGYPPVLQPPGTGGIPQPLYGPPPTQHHIIPTIGGSGAYPVLPMSGYPQPPLTSTTSMTPATFGSVSGVSAATFSSSISSGFGPIHRPVSMQLSVPVPSPIPLDRLSNEQAAPSTTNLSYQSSSTTLPATDSISSAPAYDPSCASVSTEHGAPLTTAATTSTSVSVTSSFSPLPLRVESFTPTMVQQAPERLYSFDETEEKAEDTSSSALSSSYHAEDPFTASVSFNPSYPASPPNPSPIGASSSFAPSSVSTSTSPTATSLFDAQSTNTALTNPSTSEVSSSDPQVLPPSYPSSFSPSYTSSSFPAAATFPTSPMSTVPSEEIRRTASPPPLYSGFAPRQTMPPSYSASASSVAPSSPSASLYPSASAPTYPGVTIGQPTYSSGKEKDLGERIQWYEKKAEKLVVTAVERPDKLSETEKKMKDLINKIKADQESLTGQFARRNDAEAVSQRLTTILKYIQENYDLMKRFGSLYAEDQLSAFEERVYGLLNDVNGINGQNVDEATRFHQRMTALMREMALYHSVLRKKIEEEQKTARANGAAQDDMASMNKNHLVNRLEDLQENMADFEHNFCTQYKVKRDLGDRAKQMFKQMKVKEAQQKHNVAQDSLYEL